jgi:hypothetical protein
MAAPSGVGTSSAISVRNRNRTPRAASAWYSGANTVSPIPARSFQKIAPL